MKKKDKIEFVTSTLDHLYPETPIPLEHSDAYTLLIAVLLSAQSTDKKVNTVTPILFDLADTPQKMVKLTIDEIKEVIKPIGLSNNKSKAIWELSKILLDKFDGVVPDNFEDLESLPGWGIRQPL
ncbi:MAG: hypothetical protein R2771_03725 [Saprospiraceae bacterium]